MKRLKVAVIGTGCMGQGHCATVEKKVRAMQLVAVCDGSEQLAKKTGREFSVPFFTSHRKLISSGLADAVIVATPHVSHATISIDCAKSGLHVLCEKPLSERISRAEQMVQAADSSGVALGVMFQRRFEPQLEAALNIGASGELGQIHRAVMISPEFRTQTYYDSNAWRATWRGEGGGVLINQAPHVIDIFVQIAGLPVSVSGHVSTRMHHIEVEDTAEARLGFEGGGSGYVYCSTNEPTPGQMIEIFGDKGKLLWRDGKTTFHRYRTAVSSFAENSTEMWASPEMQQVRLPVSRKRTGTFSVMRNFANHILHGESLRVTGASALASLELTNGIMLSSWEGRELSLPFSRRNFDIALKQRREQSTLRKRRVKVSCKTDPRLIA